MIIDTFVKKILAIIGAAALISSMAYSILRLFGALKNAEYWEAVFLIIVSIVLLLSGIVLSVLAVRRQKRNPDFLKSVDHEFRLTWSKLAREIVPKLPNDNAHEDARVIVAGLVAKCLIVKLITDFLHHFANRSLAQLKKRIRTEAKADKASISKLVEYVDLRVSSLGEIKERYSGYLSLFEGKSGVNDISTILGDVNHDLEQVSAELVKLRSARKSNDEKKGEYPQIASELDSIVVRVNNAEEILKEALADCKEKARFFFG